MDAGVRAKQEARAEAVSARQKQAKKRSLQVVNEHFEPVFNAAMTTQIVFKQPVGPVGSFVCKGYACRQLNG